MTLLNAHGKPVAVAEKICPTCGKGPELRKPANAFGEKYDLCINCGHEFREVSDGR